MLAEFKHTLGRKRGQIIGWAIGLASSGAGYTGAPLPPAAAAQLGAAATSAGGDAQGATQHAQRNAYHEVTGDEDVEGGVLLHLDGQVSGEDSCSGGDDCTAWAMELAVGTWGTASTR